MSGELYDLKHLEDVRGNWTQAVIDRLLEQHPGALLVEWSFVEELVRSVGGIPEYQLRVHDPERRVYVWVPSPYGALHGMGSWAGPFLDADEEVVQLKRRVEQLEDQLVEMQEQRDYPEVDE